eukprot:TRINITY_DN6317_c0_g1_i2.p1 TRINITY_DN6317_c0_g1~~TRINITY_DN6317_c0_g1_i2.p1  ORF type:complete len:491 (+),score=72.64 TRINITY_DN6317_c0_g1_i2:88-1560(+)
MLEKKQEKSRSRVWTSLLVAAYVFSLGFAIFSLVFFPLIFQSILQSELTIKPGSAAFEAWKKPSIPTIIKFYLFSVKNPEEVQDGGKPSLEQVGPFVYREEVERVNEEFLPDGTVNFETRKFWYFLESESADLDSIVTSLDVPQFAAAESVRGSWSALGVKMTISWRTSLFVKKTARELLFDGFSDPLLTAGAMFNQGSKIPMDKFGWFYGRNGTTWSDDVINMATGIKDYQELGEIRKWKGTNRTNYPGQCGDLKGSACGFVPVDETREEIDYFSPDICRPIQFSKVSSYFHNELPVDKFGLNATYTFGNASTNPATSCYYPDHPAGVHNATGCKDAGILPVFVSLPHFLDADPSYRDQFEEGSFQPDSEKHSAYMVFQSNTSIPLQIRMRLQIILQLRENPDIGGKFSKLRNTFLPVMWFDASADTTPEMENMIWFLVYTPLISRYVGLGILAFSCVFLSILIYKVVKLIQIRKIKPEKGTKEELERL